MKQHYKLQGMAYTPEHRAARKFGGIEINRILDDLAHQRDEREKSMDTSLKQALHALSLGATKIEIAQALGTTRPTLDATLKRLGYKPPKFDHAGRNLKPPTVKTPGRKRPATRQIKTKDGRPMVKLGAQRKSASSAKNDKPKPRPRQTRST